MIRRLLMLLAAALALAGCATTADPYIEAQKAALVKEGEARVAEAQAIAAIAPKLDAGGAAAYAMMVAMRGVQAQAQPARVERPRDWIDGLNAVSVFVGALGNIAVPVASIRASRDVAIAGYNRDVGIATVQQAGESARISTVAGIATSIATAPKPPTTAITVTAGGDSLIGSGTIDRRDCRTLAGRGGNAAPGDSWPTDLFGGRNYFPGGPGGPGGSAVGGC